MKGISLFSSAGIDELMLNKVGIKIVVANELLSKRVEVYKFWHPKVEVINGDITNDDIKRRIICKAIDNKIDFILNTPPCQGVSLIGKNKSNSDMAADERNYLIFHSFDIMDEILPKYIMIENVPRFLNLIYDYNGERLNITQILEKKYGEIYNIDVGVYNAADYGVPQNRQRAIIKMYKKGLTWLEPKKQKIITVREAIGHLPSIESGEVSSIKNHAGRKHTEKQVLWMKNTPTGKSAFENEIYYPKKSNGEKLKGYSATYKRINWDKPAPTITMRNDAISSQSNVHPGRKLSDGTYSDARVLSLRELFILSSINPDINVPDTVSEIQLRHMVGEGVPPKLIYEIIKGIKQND